MLSTVRTRAGLAPLSLILLLMTTVGFSRGVQVVTHGGDDGPGSFRAAVEVASADPSVRRIIFRRGLDVVIASDVVYTGAQKLFIVGNGSTITGDPATEPAETWDGGLFVSTGGADVTIRHLSFLDSWNNGIGVFVPEDATGTIRLRLERVTVDRARFHGVFFDGQTTTGFNTDDVLHPDCFDPYPADPAAGMSLRVNRSTITNNGTLAGGFNTGEPFELDGETVLTGCPADFDGIRVDDGGDGGIKGVILHSTVDGNLADGIEFDDTGAGSVVIFAAGTQINGNGETGTDDLDDGLDLDEAGEGDLWATLVNLTLRDNRDEGLDFDEAGAGSAYVFARGIDSSANEDEGLKIDEEDEGSLTLRLVDSTIDDSLSQDGLDLTEEGDGNFDALILSTQVTGNDNDAIDAEQADAGVGTLKVVSSDLTGNGNPSLDLDGVSETLIDTLVD